jgi:hypothetical protein
MPRPKANKGKAALQILVPISKNALLKLDHINPIDITKKTNMAT